MSADTLTAEEQQKVELQQVRYAHRQKADWLEVFHTALVEARQAGCSYGRLGGACGMTHQGVRQYMLRNGLAAPVRF